ncbi:MAG: hypothetical protein RMJ51_06590 [Candidatus Calescibacterium sp.]|nr:hypothetical protein [Candidatus Calescibacterium sp.]MCX7758390.1 hypothetical protein [bacterium]MDW8195885.1 hypothetical protein [Candidatus Calescibacterium sp.]
MQVIHDRLPNFVNTYEEGDVIPITTQDFYREDVTTTDYYITYEDNIGGDIGSGDTGAWDAGDPLVVDLDGNNMPDVSQGINILKKIFDRSRAKFFDLNADKI